jgi:hypothetical protein
MPIPILVALTVLFLVADVIILRRILARRRTTPALDAFVVDQGWDRTELPPTLGKGAAYSLADPATNWSLMVSFAGKSRSLARISWSVPTDQTGAVVIAPPLAPQVAEIMAKTPDGLGASMIEGTMAQAMKRLGDIPADLELDRDTIGAPQGILLKSDPPASASETLYNSPTLATLREKLPRSVQLSVVLDDSTLSIRAEVATKTPDHLQIIVDAGNGLRREI